MLNDRWDFCEERRRGDRSLLSYPVAGATCSFAFFWRDIARVSCLPRRRADRDVSRASLAFLALRLALLLALVVFALHAAVRWRSTLLSSRASASKACPRSVPLPAFFRLQCAAASFVSGAFVALCFILAAGKRGCGGACFPSTDV